MKIVIGWDGDRQITALKLNDHVDCSRQELGWLGHASALGDPNGNQLPPDRMTLALTAQEDKTSNATRNKTSDACKTQRGKKCSPKVCWLTVKGPTETVS
jgi:hypothetical protein